MVNNNNNNSKGKQTLVARVPTAAMLMFVAATAVANVGSVQGAAVSVSSSVQTAIPQGGMVTHKLDSQGLTGNAAAAALSAAAVPTMNAANNKGASSVISMLSANGSSNPDLISKAVSLASATTTNTNTNDERRYATASSSSPSSSAAASGRVEQAAKATTTTTATTSDDDDGVWHWNAGSFGCADGSPSGTAYVCHATGTPSSSSASERRGRFDRRQSDDTENKSGNGGPPVDVINKDSPDVPWLDLIVGAIPYKNGDLAPSIVWILATLFLIPFFLVRLLRRSSLVAHVLFTVFLWITVMVVTFGIRAYLSNTSPKTSLIIAENIMLQVLPCLLLEPLINLLSLYAQQGGFPTGVPRVALFLRFLNLVALIIYVVGGAYLGVWLNGWDAALQDPSSIADRSSFPADVPMSFIRIGPIVAAFMQVICVIGALLLIPIARGENGSMRPGGFIAVLVVLVTLPIVYRVLQTLHAQSELSSDGNNDNPFSVLAVAKAGSTMSSAAMNAVLNLVPVAQVAPTGMYSRDRSGIDWDQLQQTLASRGRIQSPIVFNLVFIFPQWLQTFLFFFVHAPGSENHNKLAPASQQP